MLETVNIYTVAAIYEDNFQPYTISIDANDATDAARKVERERGDAGCPVIIAAVFKGSLTPL